ncbi:MAG: phage holin family protein [Candidatus Doudnabacteria bacterium]|nr:phage holin family protein [Candidatus Doudnabacteria bacterium]
MKILLKILLSALAVLVASYVLPGVRVESFTVALVVAVVLGLLNALVKPVLVVLTLPVTVVTLGLFLLVINAALVLIADRLVGGFSVSGFWWALVFSLVVSSVNWFLGRASN